MSNAIKCDRCHNFSDEPDTEVRMQRLIDTNRISFGWVNVDLCHECNKLLKEFYSYKKV